MRAQTGNNNGATERSARIIRAGFIIVMVLVGGFSVFAVSALFQTRTALDQLVHNEQEALALQLEMQQAARERALVLYRIVILNDPFERDAQIQRFNELEGRFGAARSQLLELDLDKYSKTLLGEQGRQAAVIRTWMDEVVTLAMSGRGEDALLALEEKAIPAQDDILATINAMLAYQISKSHDKAEKLQQLQGGSIWLLAVVGAAALLLVGFIAHYVRRSMGGLVGEISASAKNLEQAYKQLEYQKLAMDQHDIVSIADIQGNISYVNDKFCEVSQYAREELIGKNHRLLKSGVQPDSLYREMWETITDGRVWHGEICNRKKDGGLYWVATTIVPFLDDTGLPYQYVSVRTDITDIKEAQQVLLRGRDELEELVLERTAELAEREDVLRSISDAAHDAVIMLDPRGKVTFWNPAAEKIFGYAESEILSRSFHALLVAGRQLEEFQAGFAELQKSDAWTVMGKTAELTALRNDGAEIIVEISLSAVKIRDAWHAIGIARDITSRKLAEQQLELLATTDSLTGAGNRRRFDEALRAEIARSRRYGAPLGLVIFDIDHFKRINDSFGHAVGDQVLAQLAGLILGKIRETDLLARIGGEEFAVLTPNCNRECARQLAEKLRRLVEAEVFPGVERVTCSFGVNAYRLGDDPASLLRRADEALYEAKGAGRNRVAASGQ